jgi:phosphoadenosine phosphosulfate reductase
MNLDATRILIAAELDLAAAPCVTASFQAESIVLLHLLRERRPDIPVLFVDTLHHFQETLDFRDQIAAEWGLNLITLKAVDPAPGLWRDSTQACCHYHKVAPLHAALRKYDVWFAGLRRDQSASRANLKEVDGFTLPGGHVLKKVSPLSTWHKADVWRYVKTHGLPLLPLYDEGYTSIGCEPCTSLPLDPNDDRSGRWGGRKLECGIHVQASNAP